MTRLSPREVAPSGPVRGEVRLPPSKSYTNRALVAAALASGTSRITAPSRSQDSNYMTGALVALGVGITTKEGALDVAGTAGALTAPAKPIFVGNAGTTFRFLTAAAAIAAGEVTLTGDAQMRARPIGDLCDALARAGVRVTSADGFPPVTVTGGSLEGGSVSVPGEKSSQFLSALLLAAPYARTPMTITITGELSSAPYVAMTLEVMRAFGARVEIPSPGTYVVDPSRRYRSAPYTVEPDASSASYFLAAAAVTKGFVRIPGLSGRSLQGDVRFADTLVAMGCTLEEDPGALALRGAALSGIDVDMNAMPDCVPTLAVVALFADGPTTIRNVAHLRYKETDRIAALAAELAKLGAQVDVLPDGLVIRPPRQGALTPAVIETYRDHRIAMSFAVAGLALPGVLIADPGCVAKSFPGFWDAFTALATE